MRELSDLGRIEWLEGAEREKVLETAENMLPSEKTGSMNGTEPPTCSRPLVSVLNAGSFH